MKTITALLLPFLFTFSLTTQNATQEATIKQIIERETLALANADLATGSGYFVHEPYLRWTVSTTMFFDGWDALYQGAKSFLESQSGRAAANNRHAITRKDWDIHVLGDMTWVKFLQNTEGNPVTSHQFRVLERTGDGWKIAMLSVVQ